MDGRRVGMPGVALLCALLAGCGSGDARITASTADTLHAQVNAVRTAAAAGKNSVAQEKVADLRATIRQLAGSGELNAADSLVLLTQLDRIADTLDARPTPTPTPSPTPKPSTAASSSSGGSSGGSSPTRSAAKHKPPGKAKGHKK